MQRLVLLILVTILTLGTLILMTGCDLSALLEKPQSRVEEADGGDSAPAEDPDKVLSSLTNAGYNTFKDMTVVPAAFEWVGYDLKAVVTGSKTTMKDGVEKTERISVYYFADGETAARALEKVRKDESGAAGSGEDWVTATVSGCTVYFGTKTAVEDAAVEAQHAETEPEAG